MIDQELEKKVSRYRQEYDELKSQLNDFGIILQGFVYERYMKCGKPDCRCHKDPNGRHGPYRQWTCKSDGKTVSVYLDERQVILCKEGIANNHRLEAILKSMRKISRELIMLTKVAPKTNQSRKSRA